MESKQANKLVGLNMITYLLPAGIAMLFAFARLYIFTDVLTTDEYNTFMIVNAVVMSLYLMEAGLATVFSRNLSNDLKSKKDITPKLNAVRPLFYLIGLVFVSFMIGYGFILGLPKELLLIFYLHTFTGVIIICGIYYSLIILANHQRYRINIFWNISQIAILIFDVVVIFTTGNLVLAAITTIACRTVYLLWVKREVNKLYVSSNTKSRDRKILHEGRLSIFSTIIDVGYENAPVILLSILTTPVTILIYNLLKPIFNVVRALFVMMINSFREIMSSFGLKQDKRSLAYFELSQSVLMILLTTMLFALVMVVVPFSNLVLSGEIEPTFNQFSLFSVFILFMLTRMTVRLIRESVGLFQVGVIFDLVNLIFGVVMALVLYGMLGAYGIMLGFIVSSIVIEIIGAAIVFGRNSHLATTKTILIFGSNIGIYLLVTAMAINIGWPLSQGSILQIIGYGSLMALIYSAISIVCNGIINYRTVIQILRGAGNGKVSRT